METPPDLRTPDLARSDSLDLEEAIALYLWTLDNIPGFPWAADYDIAKLRIADAILGQRGLPLGPSKAQLRKWELQ